MNGGDGSGGGPSDRSRPGLRGGSAIPRGVHLVFLVGAEFLLLVGALVWTASAVSADFDLGADLELGRAVHGGSGPVVAAAGAVMLVAIGVVSIWRPTAGGWTLAGLAVAAGAVAVALAALVTFLDDDLLDVSFEAVPFVIAFFTVPSLTTSVLLLAAGSGQSGGTVDGPGAAPAGSGPAGAASG